MTTEALPRPGTDEYAPYYAGYISEVPEGDLLETLTHQLDEILVLCGSIGEAQGDHAYAPGKWTIKEVLGHLNDAERVFAYRALRIARGDTTPLPGFDENVYTPESGARARTLADLAEEFAAIRRATLSLLATFTAETAARRGTASGNPASARAVAWTIAGHAGHHVRILRERYLGQ